MTPQADALRALHELTVREVNDEIARVSRGLAADELHVLCECGTVGCSTLLEVEAPEYAAVRAKDERFLVANGHEQLDIERVARRSEDFAVVEKVGIAKKVALRLRRRDTS